MSYDNPALIGYIATVIVGLVAMAGVAIGSASMEGRMQREAIAAGCATWVTGAAGKPEFKWKVNVEAGK